MDISDGTFRLIFTGTVLFMIGLAVLAVVNRRRQRVRLAAYAESRGWDYTPSGHMLADVMGKDFPFMAGDTRRYSDVFTYWSGNDTGLSFDFTYSVTTGSGDDQTTTSYSFHVVTLNLPIALPRLMLRPQTKTDSVGKAFGRQDIQFESADFNRTWLVQGDNLVASHDIVDPRMMEWLLSPSLQNAAFTIVGSRVVTYGKGGQKTDNIDDLIARLQGFVARIPNFVWDKALGK